MPRRPRSHPTLPGRAEDYLDRFAKANSSLRTEATYRNSLSHLQLFAEETQLTPGGVPLDPGAWKAQTLAQYYDWLTKHQSTRKRAYSNDTLRLHLMVAQKYVRWLGGHRLLEPGVTVIEIDTALEDTLGNKHNALPRGVRDVDYNVGALLNYYHSQLAATPDDAKHHPQRLILLRNHALMQVLYATAGRASEVAQLTRAKVREGNALSIKITGKGNKERPLLLTEPAKRAIREYLKARGDKYPGLFVSHGRNAGHPINTKTMWAIVDQAALKVLGAGTAEQPRQRVGPHAFRHLRAQHLVDEGIPLDVLQSMLGHADIGTTRRIYAPKTREDILLDNIGTYGRDPEKVARDAQRDLDQQKAAQEAD
jgi:site-specific recombinase XerD